MSKFFEWLACSLPPTVNGATLAQKDPRGQRAVAVTAVASEVVLSGDIFLQPKDGGGNQGGVDMSLSVRVRFTADGDDLCLIFGAKGAGLTPDPAAVTGSTPANVCGVIFKGTSEDYYVSPKSQPSVYVRGRTGAATMRYRVIGSLSDQR